jgi:hypothetical protein
MPRNITVHFSDGTAHQYNNAPDDFTPDQVEARTKRDYPNKKIVRIDGGKKTSSWHGGSSNKIYKDYTEEQIIKAVEKAKESSLIDSLKDPDSAKFRRLEVWVIPDEKNPNESSLWLFGEIAAKNSYGAYNGYKEFYALEVGLGIPSGGTFIMLGMSGQDRYDVIPGIIAKYKARGKLLLTVK